MRGTAPSSFVVCCLCLFVQYNGSYIGNVACSDVLSFG